ncbi:hypothetical protein EDC01DRAFT_204588 [Geopyxis carbonaria]|nr:hypothetical protein EDC01DRAFT_204588 [Geopyxis carbonaria]
MSDTADEDPFASLQLSDTEPSPAAASNSARRAEKLNQSEAAFRAQKAAYHVSFSRPPPETPLALKAKAEERYFLRDYAAAAEMAERALGIEERRDGGKGEGERLHENEVAELKGLVEACGRRRAGVRSV